MSEQELIIEKYLKKFEEKFINYVPKIPTETNHCAVIVETRRVDKMSTILKNHMYFLNQSDSNIKWGLQIFHGLDNEEYVKSITKDWKNVDYVNTGVVNFTKTSYSQYCKTPNFWNKIKSDKILIFQTDSLLLRHGIDDFLNFDYIGAPWTKPKEGTLIGNGGLSLRTKQKMIEISEKYNNENDFTWEDIFFSKYLMGDNFPDLETAMKFSVEDVFHPKPLGVHFPIKIPIHLLDTILNNSLLNL